MYSEGYKYVTDVKLYSIVVLLDRTLLSRGLLILEKNYNLRSRIIIIDHPNSYHLDDYTGYSIVKFALIA